MKIKMKLIIVAAVLLVVTIAAFSIFLDIQLNTTADAIFRTYLSDIAKLQTESVDRYVQSTVSRYDFVASLPAVKTFTAGNYSSGSSEYSAAAAELESLVESGTLQSAVVYSDNGDIVLSAGVNSSVTKAEGVCDTEAPERTPAIFSAEGAGANDYTVSITGKSGNFSLGLTFPCKSGSTDSNSSYKGLAYVIQQAKGLVFVVDPFGDIALTSAAYGGNYNENNATPQFAPYKTLVSEASSVPAQYVSADGTILAYAAKTESGWTVVTYQEAIKAKSTANSAVSTVRTISIVMLVLCFVAAVILIITVTKPFYKIQETLLKISRGDHEARVEIMSHNEYGDIARVFNDIVDNIIVSESRYRTIIEMSDNIIFEWNLDTKQVNFSNNFNKKFSYRAPSEHFADSFLIKCKVHPEDAERYTSDLQKLEKGENFKHNEYRIKNIYGDYIWVLIRTSSILDAEGKTVKIVGVIVDIDRAKKSENILTARASFDSLTNVFNRETIEVAINNEIELIAARKSEFAILFVDIDDFKFYNDQYSHATGDQVLRFTATTIKNAVGDKGMVGRYGGDEFIVCIKEADANDPAIVAEQILNTLKEGFDSDSGDHLTVNVSIGISVIRDNSKRVEEIIGQADDAMYKIKKSGKSNFGFLET